MKKLISAGSACVTAWLLMLPAFADIIDPGPPEFVETSPTPTVVSVLAVAVVIVAAAVLVRAIRRRRR